ncbi:CD3e molecule, epsilon associated protein [Rhincodon typus]|uniref:CD3e molecule, epsilon associated protein n=1 Tax=Rhincodon typus TaxID=259920 RepID=UPI0009A2D7B3|nr:CD3e molecule, epsilon associated protein [Rhincodon typus]
MEVQNWAVSSSEESEAERPDTPPRARGSEPPPPGPSKAIKFQCPLEFTPCPRTTFCDLVPEKVNDPSTELWLIKAPIDFDPQSFSGRKIPLVGFQTLKSKTCKDKLYNVFGTPRAGGGVCLVLPSATESCPPFAGSITIGESWEDTGGNDEPHSIPTSPAPSIPPGLKLRFQPFGAAPPSQLPHKKPCPVTAAAPQLGDVRELKAKRRKGLKGMLAVSGDEPDHKAVADSPRKRRKSKKEQEEAGFEHSDIAVLDPKNKKREKKRRREREIPQTPHAQVNKGHKKKKKKDKH